MRHRWPTGLIVMPTSPRITRQWNRSVFPTFYFSDRKIRHAAYRLIRGTEGVHRGSENWACRSCLRINTTNAELQQSVMVPQMNFTLNQTDKESDVQVELRELYSIVVPVMLTGCVLSLLINLIILIGVRWVRRPLSPTLCFSVSLSVTNAYASLVLATGLVVNSLLPVVLELETDLYYACYVLALEAFRMAGLIASVLHLLALAVNHYIGITRPLHYASTVTRKTAAIGIIAIWILPVLFFFVYFSSMPGNGFQANCQFDFVYYSTYRLIVSLLFFLPLLLMTVIYIRIFLTVRQQKDGPFNYPTSRQLHKNVKAVITTLLILGTYLIGWMPAVLFFALTCFDCPIPILTIPNTVRIPISIFNNSLIVAKSFIDPIIYVVRMAEIKEALKIMWSSICGLEREEVSKVDHQLSTRTTKRYASIVSSQNRKLVQNGNKNFVK